MSGEWPAKFERKARSVGGRVWATVDRPLDRVGAYAEVSFTLLLATFFCLLLALTPRYDLQSQVYPLLVGIPGLALTSLLFLSQVGVRPAVTIVDRVSVATVSIASEDDSGERDQRAMYTMVFWVFFLFVLVVVLGFLVGSLFFLVLFYRFQAHNDWRRAIGYSAAIWLPVVFVFDYLLNVRFSGGIISSLGEMLLPLAVSLL